MSAQAAGMDFPSLINRILDLAWERYETAAPLKKPLTRGAVRLRDGGKVPSCLRNSG
jgi:hypothetical protein